MTWEQRCDIGFLELTKHGYKDINKANQNLCATKDHINNVKEELTKYD